MIYPLSKGLLVSMALRCDHSFLAPLQAFTFEGQQRILIGYDTEQRIEFLKEMKQLYLKMASSDWVPHEKYEVRFDADCRGWEEMTGAGYYAPSKEESYAADFPAGVEIENL